MQTIEGYVFNSRINTQRRAGRATPVVVASVVAVLGAGVSVAAWSRLETAPRPKYEARAAPLPSATPQAEADLAAFQQSIALSHLAHVESPKVEAPATPTPVAAPIREAAPRLAQTPAKKLAPIVVALPPARPLGVIAAPELPPAPAVETPADRDFPIIGGLVRQVGALPMQARGLASGAGDRFFSAVSFVRERTGF